MGKKSQERRITPEKIRAYALYLQEEEKSPATIRKYTHDLNLCRDALPDGELTKVALILWKENQRNTPPPA